MDWILANMGTICIGIIVAALVSVILINSIRKRKQGKVSCACGCANCPMKNKCH